jgi:Prefoldin subunit
MSENDSQSILNTYKAMTSECQTIANKITELTSEKDEHKLVVDTLTKLEPGRKAFRLVGGVLVERTVEEVLPAVSQNFEGVSVDRFSRGIPYTDLQLTFWLLHLNLIRLKTCFKNWMKLSNRRIKTEKPSKRSMES